MERLQDRLFQKSRDMRPPWGPILRALRYPAALLRDWLEGELTVQATSLAYTTLLALVPLIVFCFAILKGLGARTDIYFILHEFFRPLGNAADQLTETVLAFVANMRGTVLGSIGLAFLIYTVISTIQKVEASFNFVWRIDRPRGLARRIAEYLSAMIVGPILLAAALGLLASAAHSSLAEWLGSFAPLSWLLRILGRLTPYGIVTAVFMFMYAFVPNTRVGFRPALIGGVTAGVIWALVGKAFSAFIVASSHMMAVYTGFAIVLTTLIWVYLSWLILLIGAQLAFYVQFPEYLRHGHEPLALTGSAWEHVGLTVMYLIGRDHRSNRPGWTASRLAAELDLPGSALRPVLACLEKAEFIVTGDGEALRPGRAPQDIQLAALIEALRTQQRGRLTVANRPFAPVGAVITDMESAIRLCLANRSLEDLIASV
ncbi:MAG TPA: YihY/virulence factor BrkB family protein [Pseudomonadota bacterium]|nr:YihY/virulence factor BrkB family protein [Pseudomonadota bacterium]